MPWTTPKDWVAGSPLAAAELNEQIRDNEQWIKDTLTIYGQTSDSTAKTLKGAIAGTRLYRSSDQSITDDGTFQQISWNSEQFDTANGVASTYHSTVTNTQRITVPSGRAGYYLVNANVSFAVSGSGTRRMRIQHSTDGVIAADSRAGVAGILTQMAASCVWYFGAGDYAYVEVLQSSGGALAVDGSTNAYLPAFSLVQLGV